MGFTTWAAGVLSDTRITAPVSQTNFDTLWAWSGAESGVDRMRWNNPLNTTQPWPNAVDMNSVGVKAYATEADGVAATCVTLVNGDYPVILDHLRYSVPRQQWGDACGNLGVWGTGCGWLNADYGAAPTAPGGFDMSPELEAHVLYMVGLGRPYVGNEAQWLIDRIKAGAGPGETLGAVLASDEGRVWAARLAQLRAGSTDDDSALVSKAALVKAVQGL